MADKQRPARARVAGSSVRAFRSRLLHWFDQHGRRLPWRTHGQSVYRVIIAEVLLQRTRAEVVAGVYSRFFGTYPTWTSLAGARRSDLLSLLRPLGLWRRRVDVIGKLAHALQSRRGRLPSSRQEIEELPGVGQYIANAIELVRWGTPRPLLDVNMARVLERYFGPRDLADIRYDPYLQDLAQRVVASDDALALNWAILDLGALVCTAREPKCPICPLRRHCRYAQGLSCAKGDRIVLSVLPAKPDGR